MSVRLFHLCFKLQFLIQVSSVIWNSFSMDNQGTPIRGRGLSHLFCIDLSRHFPQIWSIIRQNRTLISKTKTWPVKKKFVYFRRHSQIVQPPRLTGLGIPLVNANIRLAEIGLFRMQIQQENFSWFWAFDLEFEIQAVRRCDIPRAHKRHPIWCDAKKFENEKRNIRAFWLLR